MLIEKSNWNTGDTVKLCKEKCIADEQKKELCAKYRIFPGKNMRKVCKNIQTANIGSLKKYDYLITADLANILLCETRKIHFDLNKNLLHLKKVHIPSGRMQMLC